MSNLFLKTIRELFVDPQNVVDGFLSGEKSKSTHPFKICISAALLVVVFNSVLVNFSIPSQANPDIENEQIRIMTEWIQAANIRAATQFLPFSMIFILIPTLSLAGLFFFRDKLEGFYSNLILNAYATGAAIISLLLIIPVWMFSGIPIADPLMNSSLPALLIAGVILWIYRQYFGMSSALGWLKMVSSFILGYMLFIILSGFAAGVFGYLFYAVNRILEIAG